MILAKDILTVIQENMSTFSKGQRLIANYILESYDKAAFMTACKLGKTTLVSGFAQLLDSNTPARGFPIFRHTPLLQWFVADSGKEVSDRRLVMMLCPEIVDMSRDGDLNVDREISIPVTTEAAKTTDQRLEERKKHTGFWSWLNWFTF